MAYALVTAGKFYTLFTIQERIAIKKSDDPFVKEFWETYQNAVATNEEINLGSPAVQGGLSYLVAADQNPATDPVSKYLTAERRLQILGAIQQ